MALYWHFPIFGWNAAALGSLCITIWFLLLYFVIPFFCIWSHNTHTHTISPKRDYNCFLVFSKAMLEFWYWLSNGRHLWMLNWIQLWVLRLILIWLHAENCHLFMTSGITVRPTLENPFPILRKKDDELVSASILPFFFSKSCKCKFFFLNIPYCNLYGLFNAILCMLLAVYPFGRTIII